MTLKVFLFDHFIVESLFEFISLNVVFYYNDYSYFGEGIQRKNHMRFVILR